MDQLSALAVSITVEGITAALLLARQGRAKALRGIVAAALATVVTHPVAWWSTKALAPAIGYGETVAVVEVLVCLAEAPAYRLLVPVGWPAAVAVSVAANLASMLAGLLYYYASRA